MRSVFPGFPAEGLQFMRGLARNNNRDWFLPRKSLFEEKVKQPMRELVEAVNGAMKSFAPEYISDPDKAVFRIYRDTRFSKDKAPYKTVVGMSFGHDAGKEVAAPGLYLQLEPGTSWAGGGAYHLETGALNLVRDAIVARSGDYAKVTSAPALAREAP